MDLCQQIMSLLFNMPSRLVIAFLPRSKCLLISWLQSPSAVILEPKKIKSVTVSMRLDVMIFVFWMLSFKLAFSLSSFPFITRHIHNWASHPLRPSLFIDSGAIGNLPLLFTSSLLDTFRPGGLIFWCHTFLAFYIVHEVLIASYPGLVCYSLLQWITFCQNSQQSPQDWIR